MLGVGARRRGDCTNSNDGIRLTSRNKNADRFSVARECRGLHWSYLPLFSSCERTEAASFFASVGVAFLAPESTFEANEEIGVDDCFLATLELHRWGDITETPACFNLANSARIDSELSCDVMLHHSLKKKTFDASSHLRRYAR